MLEGLGELDVAGVHRGDDRRERASHRINRTMSLPPEGISLNYRVLEIRVILVIAMVMEM
jgi:hypothetical protein